MDDPFVGDTPRGPYIFPHWHPQPEYDAVNAQPNLQANWPTISTFENARPDLQANLPTISTLENSSEEINSVVSRKNRSPN